MKVDPTQTSALISLAGGGLLDSIRIDMVFAAVDPSIREKVVAAYLAGKGRNQIDREFRSQGIKVSHGSISNMINKYKREHEQPSPSQSSSMVHNIPSLSMTDDMRSRFV